MRVIEQIVRTAPLKYVRYVTGEDLSCCLQERIPRIRNDFADGDARVIEAFVAEEIVNDQRLIDPRPDVRVPCVVFAEEGFHLSDLRREVIRKGHEIRVTLFQIDSPGSD